MRLGRQRGSAFAMALLFLAGCGDHARQAQLASLFTADGAPGRPVVLDGVTVVNTYTGELSAKKSVVMQNGLITGIVQSDHVAVPDGGVRIDARGKFVVPGYLDMHAHPLSGPEPDRALSLMLANGITGFRQMSGSDELLALRSGGRRLADTYPELLAMPGPIITRLVAATADKVNAEVGRQAGLGADFIKIVDSNPESLNAALAAGKERRLPVVGHLPPTVDAYQAAAAGMRSIEHLGPSSVLISCSSDEAAIRKHIELSPPAGPPALPAWLVKILQPFLDRRFRKVIANPYLIATDDDFALMQRLMDTYAEDKCVAFSKRLAGLESWQVPTLIRLRTMVFGNDPAYRNQETLRFVPPERIQYWNDIADKFEADLSPEHRRTLAKFYELLTTLVRAFARADVRMLAGSDLGGMWLVPGFSLHQEFDQLKAAGVPPLKVLQMTTLSGAVFLGREGTMGSVAAGKAANLVLLDKNPIEDSEHLHSIHAVVRNGHFLDADALRSMTQR